jgi:hypothetical protein
MAGRYAEREVSKPVCAEFYSLQSRALLRIIKLLLCKLRLWNVFDFLRTRGKGYQAVRRVPGVGSTPFSTPAAFC